MFRSRVDGVELVAAVSPTTNQLRVLQDVQDRSAGRCGECIEDIDHGGVHYGQAMTCVHVGACLSWLGGAACLVDRSAPVIVRG